MAHNPMLFGLILLPVATLCHRDDWREILTNGNLDKTASVEGAAEKWSFAEVRDHALTERGNPDSLVFDAPRLARRSDERALDFRWVSCDIPVDSCIPCLPP